MGKDRIESDRKPKFYKMQGPRIWIPLDVLQGAAYANLKPTAKALLLDLAGQLRGSAKGGITNNGDLTTALKVLSTTGWKSDKTIRSAARELERNKLIVKTRQGHLPNKANLYAVTWVPLNPDEKLDIASKGFPLNGYKLLDRPPELKKING